MGWSSWQFAGSSPAPTTCNGRNGAVPVCLPAEGRTKGALQRGPGGGPDDALVGHGTFPAGGSIPS